MAHNEGQVPSQPASAGWQVVAGQQLPTFPALPGVRAANVKGLLAGPVLMILTTTLTLLPVLLSDNAVDQTLVLLRLIAGVASGIAFIFIAKIYGTVSKFLPLFPLIFVGLQLYAAWELYRASLSMNALLPNLLGISVTLVATLRAGFLASKHKKRQPKRNTQQTPGMNQPGMHQPGMNQPGMNQPPGIHQPPIPR